MIHKLHDFIFYNINLPNSASLSLFPVILNPTPFEFLNPHLLGATIGTTGGICVSTTSPVSQQTSM